MLLYDELSDDADDDDDEMMMVVGQCDVERKMMPSDSEKREYNNKMYISQIEIQRKRRQKCSTAH